MHPLFTQVSGMTHDVIGAAIEVQKDEGSGLVESIYKWCLTMELGIIINFHALELTDGVSRFILPGADLE